MASSTGTRDHDNFNALFQHGHWLAPRRRPRPYELGRAATLIGAFVFMTTIALAATVLAGWSGAARAAPAAPPAAEAAPPAGLFFRGGQGDMAFEAPVLKSDVRIAVSGLISRVTVRQRFLNPTKVWLEGIYVFPLPERSAVDRLTMTVGGREIQGQIMERAEARKTYEKAARDGKRASLLSSERANVFTTSLANIGPGGEIVVEIEYKDSIAYSDGRFALRFPMVVPPRYTPSGDPAPLAEKGAPAIQPATAGGGPGRDLFGPVRHPDEGMNNPVSLAVTLDSGLPLAELTSPYHDVEIQSLDARRQVITLRDGPVPADRDFVLEWTPRMGTAPEAAVFAEEVAGENYLLVMLLPPAGGAAEVPRPPRDLVFIVDTSGSMHGASLEQAKDAMARALGRLKPQDRFNVIRFNNETYSLFKGARPATRENIAAARNYVGAFEASGGTRMRPALELALAEPAEKGHLRQVVFLTDGAVGNEQELFTRIVERLGESRLFTIGIGSAPNSYFMRKAAQLGRGTFTYIGKLAEVGKRMEALFRKLERPALTGVAAAWPGSAGLDAESYPTPVPDLYDGEPVVFTTRLPGAAHGDLGGDLVISGRRGGETWERRLDLGRIEPGPGVAAIWARSKIGQIEDGLSEGRDPIQVRAKALAVALEHELVTRYTSLVAVDDRIARPRGEGLKSGEIERNLPAGWSYEHVFGADAAKMKLRQMPPGLLRKTSTGTTAIGLPQTASPATLKALIGLGLLLTGIVLLLVLRRRAPQGVAGV